MALPLKYWPAAWLILSLFSLAMSIWIAVDQKRSGRRVSMSNIWISIVSLIGSLIQIAIVSI